MKVDLKQAVKYFFSNPSLELVFIEAISNSIDANATEIGIVITIEEFSKPETLEIEIKDNGDGFTEERFEKFCKLMKVEESSHKGIGRLEFLSYFEKIDVSSNYNYQKRRFVYSNDFDAKSDVIAINNDKKETILKFSNYYLSKIKTHDYLKPSKLKKRILEEFYPRLYILKQENKNLVYQSH
jgi:hypothetical protein